jgi:hypothetical protein
MPRMNNFFLKNHRSYPFISQYEPSSINAITITFFNSLQVRAKHSSKKVLTLIQTVKTTRETSQSILMKTTIRRQIDKINRFYGQENLSSKIVARSHSQNEILLPNHWCITRKILPKSSKNMKMPPLNFLNKEKERIRNSNKIKYFSTNVFIEVK